MKKKKALGTQLGLFEGAVTLSPTPTEVVSGPQDIQEIADSTISREAFESSRASAEVLREKVIQYLHLHPDTGATCDEMEQVFNSPHQSLSAVLTPMRKEGVIARSGLTRQTRSGKSAHVLVLANQMAVS